MLMPQAHKVKDGYFINHDTLMSGNTKNNNSISIE